MSCNFSIGRHPIQVPEEEDDRTKPEAFGGSSRVAFPDSACMVYLLLFAYIWLILWNMYIGKYTIHGVFGNMFFFPTALFMVDVFVWLKTCRARLAGSATLVGGF